MTLIISILSLLIFMVLIYIMMPSQSQYIAAPIHSNSKKLQCKTCQANGRKLAPLMEPKFNIREATKNMILLEDHLFHDDRRCPDCVRKHCLTIEAFLDEAFSLDKSGKYTTILQQTSTDFHGVSDAILKCCNEGLREDKCSLLGQRVRGIRKNLMPLV